MRSSPARSRARRCTRSSASAGDVWLARIEPSPRLEVVDPVEHRREPPLNLQVLAGALLLARPLRLLVEDLETAKERVGLGRVPGLPMLDALGVDALGMPSRRQVEADGAAHQAASSL